MIEPGQITSKTAAPGWLSRWRLDLQRTNLLRVQALARRVSRGKPLPAHLVTGERGELEALFFLRRQGYVIVARRWRSPELNGDLDLIAWDRDTLCFIEVKTRSQRDRTPATLAIDAEKRRMLSRMASAYLKTLPRPRDRSEENRVLTRFDFVSVYLPPSGVQCELLCNAYDWREDQSRRYGV